MYADDLVLCGESEEYLRAIVEQFVEVCRRRGLKVNAGKSKMMVQNGEEVLECEVHLEHVSEFKYLGCVLDKLGIDGAECSQKVVSERRVAGGIRSLVNARDLQLQCARVSLVPVCIYGSETMLWKERNLELGLYGRTTSEDCLVLGG